MTSFGVEPCGSAKQLWLRNGRASKVLEKELFRLLELDDKVYDILCDVTTTRDPGFIPGSAGDAISMRLADAVAERDTSRLRQYFAVLELEKFLASHVGLLIGALKLEVGLAQLFGDVFALPTARTLLVVIKKDKDSALRVL